MNVSLTLQLISPNFNGIQTEKCQFYGFFLVHGKHFFLVFSGYFLVFYITKDQMCKGRRFQVLPWV